MGIILIGILILALVIVIPTRPHGKNWDVGGKEVQLSLNGGLIHQPFIRTGITTDLNYRFELSKDAKSGTYRWPLTVSIQRM